MVYQKVMESIFTDLIGLSPEHLLQKLHPSPNASAQGIFGIAKAFALVNETQGRGSLHMHFLLWCDLDPSVVQKYIHDHDVMMRFLKHLDSMVQAWLSPEVWAKYPPPPNIPGAPKKVVVADVDMLRFSPSVSFLQCKDAAAIFSHNYDHDYLSKVLQYVPSAELIGMRKVCTWWRYIIGKISVSDGHKHIAFMHYMNNRIASLSNKKAAASLCRDIYTIAPSPLECPDVFHEHWEQLARARNVHSSHTKSCTKGQGLSCRFGMPQHSCDCPTYPIQVQMVPIPGTQKSVVSGSHTFMPRTPLRDQLSDCDTRNITIDLFRPQPGTTEPNLALLRESMASDRPYPNTEEQGPNSYVVPFSPALTAALSCNTAVVVLGNSTAAKCCLYYMLKYMLKDNWALTNTLSLFWLHRNIWRHTHLLQKIQVAARAMQCIFLRAR